MCTAYVVREQVDQPMMAAVPNIDSDVITNGGVLVGDRRWTRNSSVLDKQQQLQQQHDQPLHPALKDVAVQMQTSCRLDSLLGLLSTHHVVTSKNHHDVVTVQIVNNFIATHRSLLCDDNSPLIESDRYFIALMAARTRASSILICIYANEFLLRGGDVAWLNGLCKPSELSPKMRNLCELNDLLAHCPWHVTKHHITKLTSTQNARWSISELIQAVIILVHVHCLASLLSCSQLLSGSGRSSMTTSSPVITWTQTQSRDSSSSDKQILTSSYGKRAPSSDDQHSQPFCYTEWMEKFVTNPDISYPEIWQQCCKTVDGEPLRQRLNPHYFSWEVDGYTLANMSYIAFGDLIDSEFKSVKTLFHSSTNLSDADQLSSPCGIETVSVSSTDADQFHAVWQYVHHVLGVQYEDYSYKKVKQLLPEKLRSYIKLVVCCPERLNDGAFNDLVSSVKCYNKTSISAVAMEARMQVELMYCLLAIHDYQSMPPSS